MAYHINIYQGNQVRTIQVNESDRPSFGEGADCSYRLPAGSCGGRSVRFSYRQGTWYAACSGGVTCAGRPVESAAAGGGDLFVLDKASHLAVQLINTGRAAAAEIPLRGLAELLIGRSPNCSLRLKNGRVSGSHAKLYQQNGKWHICDINSSNGTYVNGKRISDQTLHEGDVILIGAHELLFSAGTLRVFGEKADVAVQLDGGQAQPKQQNRTAHERDEAKPYPFFNRSPRLMREKPGGVIEIDPAPGIGSKPEINWLTVLLPPIGTLVLTLAVTVLTAMSPFSLAFTAPMMLMGIVVAVLNYQNQTKKYTQREELLRQRYDGYISSCESQLAQAAAQQTEAAAYPHPAPEQCVAMAGTLDRRLWERTLQDEDFLLLRMGIGEEPLCVEVHTPKVGFMLEESEFTYIPQQLAEKYRMVSGVPVCCDLRGEAALGIVGQRESTVRTAHALCVEAAALHGYDELKLVVLFPQAEREQWEWMRWLPHTWSAGRDLRYMACTKYDAAQMLTPLEEELKRRAGAGNGTWDNAATPSPHYLFLIADPSLLQDQPVADYLLRGDPNLAVSCLLLVRDLRQLPHNVRQIVNVAADSGKFYLRDRAGEQISFRPDRIPLRDCEIFARSIAPVRLPEKDSAQRLPNSVTFLQGYHVQRPDQLNIWEYWEDSCNYKSLSVPIGVRANGESFYFDIHEKAHGPHGLVAGMTGSGKSEMVQSWILSMALQFSPQDVAFILIDFKGTGLILPFVDLPHLAGTISDLDTNIGRNLIALRSEVQRRKALFDSVSTGGQKVTEIAGYIKLYRAGKVKEPLPYLFVVIDEYAEFKAKFPEFTSEINTLFHVGRSLGVYIILMTQNPSGVVSGESESNVRFRWCLKVASPGASRETLGGHDDAAYITNPGRAYVRVGSDEILEPIQSFYSGAAYDPESDNVQSDPGLIAQIALDGRRVRAQQPAAQSSHKHRMTQIEAVVRYIRAYTTRCHIPDARPIWRDRMPGTIYLPQLLEKSVPHKSGELRPVIGMLDDPAAQTQRPLYLPLSRDGHAAIYGSPGSGKTVLLQTLTASVCMEYSPDEVNIYIMDFGGWSMGMFHSFPHVAVIANDNEEDKIQAIAKTMETELNRRKELFAHEGVGNLPDYLRMSGHKMPYLLLLIDNFAPVCKQYPQLEDFFIRLGQSGGNYGVYLVVTSGNTMALGYKLAQCVKTSLALELTDSSEYTSIIGKTGGLIPESLPGRGLFREDRVLEFQTALPAQTSEGGTYVTTIRALGEKLSAHWGANRAEAVAVMPDVVSLEQIQAKNGGFVLGMDTESLQPVEADLKTAHYLLLSGLPQSGKTSLLRALVKQIAVQPDSRVVLFADKSEYADCGEKLEFLPDGETADRFLEELSGLLKERQAEKKEHPDRSFAPIYFVIDGYKHCFEEISQQSVSRLRALLMAGEGLDVALVAADNASALAALTQYSEPLTILLAKGPVVLLGGRPLDHMSVELPLAATQKNQPLGAYEGWYRSAQGVCRFKAVRDQA